MLILSRQKDESIMIGDDIEVMVVSVRRFRRGFMPEAKVRLGIIAPNDKTKPDFVPVHRKEIWEKIQREKREKEQQNQMPAK